MSAPSRAAEAGLALFAVTLFLSALLLFAVQPMFTKMVLPVLGGSPSVWSIALVFFQAMLLAGYGYAHLLTRYLRPRWAMPVHLIVLACALAATPIAVTKWLGHSPGEEVVPWTLALFAASVGLPFFSVSASAPLLQAWFSRSSLPHAADPYFLYGASNLGSFAALLLYPVLIEPLASLSLQARLWQSGFLALMVLIAVAGVVAAVRDAPNEASSKTLTRRDATPTGRERALWIGLAFVPSALLVAVTTHISTDLAAAPFLWVLPLALFLLTFVLAFRDRSLLPHAVALRIQPIFVATVAPSLLIPLAIAPAMFFVNLGLVLVAFFLCAMVAHGELYRRRPAAERLTEFYFYMSIGGVLGGVFSSLLAPHLFSSVLEFPILLVAALLCRPGFGATPPRHWLFAGGIICAAAALLAASYTGWIPLGDAKAIIVIAALYALALVAALSRERPALLVAWVVAVLLVATAVQPGLGRTQTVRSFFGVHKIVDAAGGGHRLLMHGTTIHGAQRLLQPDGNPVAGRPEPLTYYYEGGPISETVAAARALKGRPLRVAVVGLGTGSMACHRQKDEAWTFFEIDPEVVRIARDPDRFRFLASCAPDARIVLGDARLTLADVEPGLDLIILDAFSSDAIPVHLLTREAMVLYMSKLALGGTLTFHVSNHYMELTQPLSRTAADLGLVAITKTDTKAGDFAATLHANSAVVAVARGSEHLAGLVTVDGWRLLVPAADQRAWTDDYSNLIQAIWRKLGS